MDGVSVELNPGTATPRLSDFATWTGACTQMYAGADVATTLAQLAPGVRKLAAALPPSPGQFPAC